MHSLGLAKLLKGGWEVGVSIFIHLVCFCTASLRRCHSIWKGLQLSLLQKLSHYPVKFRWKWWNLFCWLGFHFHIWQQVFKFFLAPSMASPIDCQHLSVFSRKWSLHIFVFTSAISNAVPQSTSLGVKKLFRASHSHAVQFWFCSKKQNWELSLLCSL